MVSKRLALVAQLRNVKAATKRRGPDAFVTAWEREITQLVYALYDLTPEEINRIEDTR
jgi:hypothetical protein